MIQLNDEQQAALDAMMSGRNVFLTGEAGTGKSTVLREFLGRCDRPCAVLAPTGVAAINVGGTTIHSFLMLKPGLMTEDSIVRRRHRFQQVRRAGSHRHRGRLREPGLITSDQLREVIHRIRKYHAQWESII